MSWDTNPTTDGLLAREDAIAAIKQKATEAGLTTFKVFYDGQMVAGPSDLPARVDMSKVRVSEVLNQA